MSLAEKDELSPHLPRSTERKLVKAQHPRARRRGSQRPHPHAHRGPHRRKRWVRLAAPNVLVDGCTSLRRADRNLFCRPVGTDALAGRLPGVPGRHADADDVGRSHGGGISSAIARALGAGRRADADALVLHANDYPRWPSGSYSQLPCWAAADGFTASWAAAAPRLMRR